MWNGSSPPAGPFNVSSSAEAIQQAEEEELASEAANKAAARGASATVNAADAEKFDNYAARAADHAERKAILAAQPLTAAEIAMAEALKRAPREFLDSIPRDEFGDIHPTPNQQQEITRMAWELTADAAAIRD